MSGPAAPAISYHMAAAKPVYICDAVRTPIGRYAGNLSKVRADDLAAVPIRALIDHHNDLDWDNVDDVYLGCANQAGEDNRNVARMAVLLAGLSPGVPGMTINRLCGSGMDAIGSAARAIACGHTDLMIAGGVESMSRAPFVVPKASAAFSRQTEFYDTTMGWRFINPWIKRQYGVDSMPETAENVAEAFQISRRDQDAFAFRSQRRAARALEKGLFQEETTSVTVSDRKGEPIVVTRDEHPRPDTTLEGLAALPTPFRDEGTVTAGNASGINDGACALLLASERAVSRYGLRPRGRFVAMATAGVEPRIMGMGPVPASHKALNMAGLAIHDMDVIEVNEAFASQAVAVLRQLNLKEDAENVNPNGGAIALGHPLGMSGARLITTALFELNRRGGGYGLCTMCVGVGQGIASVIESIAD